MATGMQALQSPPGRPPGRVVALRGVVFQSDRHSVIAGGFIRPFEMIDRWVAGLYGPPESEPLAMHAGLHVVLEDGREMVAEQQVGPPYQDFWNGLKWTPIGQFREREHGGWDVTVPATAFRGVDEAVVAQTIDHLNGIEGRPFLREDCTHFVERAVGGRLFANSPLLRALGVNARVGDPALPLLRPDVRLEPRAERLLRADAARRMPDASGDAGPPNARWWTNGLFWAVALGGGFLLGRRPTRDRRQRAETPPMLHDRVDTAPPPSHRVDAAPRRGGAMSYARQMLETSPGNPPVDEAALAVLVECIEACFDCAQACTACADACLAEQDVKNLVRCIRLNLHCADVCATTGRILSRQGSPELAREMLEVCALACRLCRDECEQHAGHMQHCRVCAEACRRCQEACNRLLASLEPPKLGQAEVIRSTT